VRGIRKVEPLASGIAYGAQIAEDEIPHGAASVLRCADDQALAWAADFWAQADPDDFQWGLGGMKVRHKETGEVLKIRTGWPIGGELESDIAFFTVRDQRLVLLGRPGSARPRTVVPAASYYGRKIEHVGGPPAVGTRIWRPAATTFSSSCGAAPAPPCKAEYPHARRDCRAAGGVAPSSSSKPSVIAAFAPRTRPPAPPSRRGSSSRRFSSATAGRSSASANDEHAKIGRPFGDLLRPRPGR
jgi:hypothetical protein